MTSHPGDRPDERDERAQDDLDDLPQDDLSHDDEAHDEAADDVALDEPMQDAATEPPLVDRVEQDDVEVRARLVPRYGRFMAIGLVLGAAGGWVWSRFGASGPWLGSGPVVDTSAVVPFLIVVGAAIGIVLGSVLAIVLDRIVGRRSRTITAERTRHRLE